MNTSWWMVLVVLLGVMTGMWWRQLRTRNASMVDAAWAAGTGFGGATLALLHGGMEIRSGFVAMCILLWGGRLGLHIFRRASHAPQEDKRYAELRRRWGAGAGRGFLWVYLIQGLLAAVFALPPAWAAANPNPAWVWSDTVAMILFLAALGGETLADHQLSAFLKNPSNKGRVCQEGWWRFSRHPNYFFEWLHWFAYPFFAWGTPGAAWILMGPVLMFLFLYRITGIPATEAHSLASRGDAYRKYQATTSAFIPWFPKTASKEIV